MLDAQAGSCAESRVTPFRCTASGLRTMRHAGCPGWLLRGISCLRRPQTGSCVESPPGYPVLPNYPKTVEDWRRVSRTTVVKHTRRGDALMAHHGKKYRAGAKMIDRTKTYTVEEAVGMLQKLPKAKYDETVEVSLKLGIDPKKADQL